MNKVLVVAAHPDDEVLGCGATIAKHTQDKDKVRVIFLSDGFTSRNRSSDRERTSFNLFSLSLYPSGIR